MSSLIRYKKIKPPQPNSYRNRHVIYEQSGVICAYCNMRISKSKKNQDPLVKDVADKTPEQIFLKNMQTLKDLLIQDNYTNIKNLNLANHNFNEIFSYLKGIIRRVTIKNEKLYERIRQLQHQLQKLDKNNKVLLRFQQNDILNLGESGYKLSNFVPLASKTAQNFTNKYTPPTVVGKKNVILGKGKSKIDIRKQTLQVQKFISKQLHNTIIQDQSKQFNLPKEMILDLYIKWNQIQNRSIPTEWRPFVKSLITNQIKRLFPNVDHTEKYYRGITFREDLLTASETKQEQQMQQQDLTFNENMEEMRDIDDGLFFFQILNNEQNLDLSFP